MDIKLAILTDDTLLQEMCTLYWEISESGGFEHKVKELAEYFDLSTGAINKLVRKNCNAYSTQLFCCICEAPRSFSTRSDYTTNKNNYHWDSWTCETCYNRQKQEQKRQAETEQKKKYKLLNHEYQNTKKAGLDINCFSFSDAIYFVSLIRVGMSEDLKFIYSRESQKSQLSPTNDSDNEILNQLYRNQLICIHPDSRADSIEIKDTSFSFYPFKVDWLLPLSDEQKVQEILNQIEAAICLRESWSENWITQSLILRRKIALQECVQYLNYVIKKHKLNFSPGEKTVHIIKSLLNNFSVAQICNFCWGAARNAAAYYMREHISNKQAANIIPGSIQRTAEKALSEGWEVKPFGRNFDVPQTMVSTVLYDTALQIGDEGFNKVIPKE